MKRLLSLTFLMLCGIPMVFAVNPVSYVASYGSDSNACTHSSPCSTFAHAITQTSSNGEVDALDGGPYNGFSISAPMVIDGGGVATIFFQPIGSTPCGTNALICVNTNFQGYATLRNLNLNTYTVVIGIDITTNGFLVFNSANVQIENVQVLSPFGDCIDVTFGQVVIKDSNLRNCGGMGVNITGGSVSLENVLIQGTGNGAVSATGSGTPVTIRNSNLNQNAGNVVSAGSGATITVDSSSISNCFPTANCKGVVAQSSGVVQLSNATITGNTVGLSAAGGSIISFVNNRIYGNGTNGAPTQSVYQK